MIFIYNMEDFMVQHILYTELLSGNDFMNLTNTCKHFRTEYNTKKCLKRLWKHGHVRDLKTALYVEDKLKRYKPEQILDEVTNDSRERDVLSAFNKLLSHRKKIKLSKRYKSVSPLLFLHGITTQPKSILGKRSKNYI